MKKTKHPIKKCSIFRQKKYKLTALQNAAVLNACKEENKEKVEALLTEGVTPTNWLYLLDVAACNNDIKCLHILIKHGANIDAKDENGNTLLQATAINNNLYNIISLLTAGANVNYKDKNGKTALHLAANRGHLNYIKIILNPSHYGYGIRGAHRGGIGFHGPRSSTSYA